MDWVMHSLGGIFIGGVSLFLARYNSIPVFRSHPYLSLFIFSFGVVCLWELFELAIGAHAENQYALDTAIDMTLGIGSGFCVYFLLWRKKAI